MSDNGSVTLTIDFVAKLPRAFARTGYHRDYFLAGQWFPKIAVYEPAGRRGRATGGWNCHQFHAHSEFYADFGRYRVAITTPSSFVVGATGQRVSVRANAEMSSTVANSPALPLRPAIAFPIGSWTDPRIAPRPSPRKPQYARVHA